MIGWLFFIIIVLYFFDTWRFLKKEDLRQRSQRQAYGQNYGDRFSVLQRLLPSPWVICLLAIVTLMVVRYWSLSWALEMRATIVWSLVFSIIGFYSHVILWLGFTEQQIP